MDIHFLCAANNAELVAGLQKNLGTQTRSVWGEKSITKAYNKLAKGINPAPEDVLVFIHQDCRLHFDWANIIPAYMNELDCPGVLGFIGARKITADGRWYWASDKCGGLIQGGGADINLKFAKVKKTTSAGLPYERVDAVDGYCLVIKAKVFEIIGGFDERFVFHYYDSDLCLNALKHGFYNYVIGQKSQHYSAGDFTVDWNPLREQFQKKWLPWLKETKRE